MSGIGCWDERIHVRAGGRHAVYGWRAEHIPVVRCLYGVYESPDTTNGVRIRPARRATVLAEVIVPATLSFLSPI
jgi:hypothetical protein